MFGPGEDPVTSRTRSFRPTLRGAASSAERELLATRRQKQQSEPPSGSIKCVTFNRFGAETL